MSAGSGEVPPRKGRVGVAEEEVVVRVAEVGEEIVVVGSAAASYVERRTQRVAVVAGACGTMVGMSSCVHRVLLCGLETLTRPFVRTRHAC